MKSGKVYKKIGTIISLGFLLLVTLCIVSGNKLVKMVLPTKQSPLFVRLTAAFAAVSLFLTAGLLTSTFAGWRWLLGFPGRQSAKRRLH